MRTLSCAYLTRMGSHCARSIIMYEKIKSLVKKLDKSCTNSLTLINPCGKKLRCSFDIIEVVSKPRYLKKETLAKDILRGCWEKNDLRHLDVSIGLVYDANKKLVEKHQDRMKKLDEIFHEFTSNPKSFVEKYAKMDNNENVLEIIEKNPDWFKGLKWY